MADIEANSLASTRNIATFVGESPHLRISRKAKCRLVDAGRMPDGSITCTRQVSNDSSQPGGPDVRTVWSNLAGQH